MSFRYPPKELIESNHRFPGNYTFKVIGTSENDFLNRVLDSVRKTLNRPAEPPHSKRMTENGRHMAITLELTLESSDQVIQVYQALTQVPGLVMLL